MVTIVLVGACVCDTDPGQEKKGNSSTMASLHTLQILKNPRKALGKKKENFSNLILVLCLKLRNKEWTHALCLLPPWQEEQGCRLTSRGCGRNGVGCQNRCYRCCSHWCASTEDRFLWGGGTPHNTIRNRNISHPIPFKRNHCLRYCQVFSKFCTILVLTHRVYRWLFISGFTWAMVWSCCFGVPSAGWDGSVILVVTSRDWAGRWILIAADGGCWRDRVGRLGRQKRHHDLWLVSRRNAGSQGHLLSRAGSQSEFYFSQVCEVHRWTNEVNCPSSFSPETAISLILKGINMYHEPNKLILSHTEYPRYSWSTLSDHLE